MRNLLKSRKAQFFVLSAFAIVTMLLLVSRWLEPLSILDTSSVVLGEESFTFNNIKEKAVSTVTSSNNCVELQYNLDEYNNFLKEAFTRKNFKLNFTYQIIQPCSDSTLATKLDISLQSPSTFIRSNFTAKR